MVVQFTPQLVVGGVVVDLYLFTKNTYPKVRVIVWLKFELSTRWPSPARCILRLGVSLSLSIGTVLLVTWSPTTVCKLFVSDINTWLKKTKEITSQKKKNVNINVQKTSFPNL